MNKIVPNPGNLYLHDNSISNLALNCVFKTDQAKKHFQKTTKSLALRHLETQVNEDIVTKDELANIDVLLIEIDCSRENDQSRLNSILNDSDIAIPILVTGENITLDVARELMHQGVVDVLPAPYSLSDVLTSLKRAIEKKGGEQTKTLNGKIISFLKAGGGAGATTIAIQSSIYVASELQSKHLEACLLDLDIQFGTIGLYLNLESNEGMTALIEAGSRLDGAMFRGILGNHRASGLKVLSVPKDIIPVDKINPSLIRRTASLLRRNYKFSFIDIPEFWTNWSATTLQQSNMIVLVTQLTVAGVCRAKRQLDTLRAQGLGHIPLKIILNRYNKNSDCGISLGEAEKVLDHKIDYTILSDYRTVNEAENQGIPISNFSSSSKVVKGIQEFTRQMVTELTIDEPVEYCNGKAHSFFGWKGLKDVFISK